jgi:Helix-turn-helix domain
MVRVVHGCNEVRLHRGRTVGEIQKSLAEVLNVRPDATALVNGHVVAADHRLVEGDNLEFVYERGHKGLGELLSPDALTSRWGITPERYRELVRLGLPAIRFADGSTVHPEVAVDEWVCRVTTGQPEAALADHLRRIADHFDPPPPDKVGSDYVAARLGCTTTWIAELVRQGEIPASCVVVGTGNGKPWKFHRTRIDEWINNR